MRRKRVSLSRKVSARTDVRVQVLMPKYKVHVLALTGTLLLLLSQIISPERSRGNYDSAILRGISV